MRRPDEAALLETGMLVMGIALAAGVLALAGGRAAGRASLLRGSRQRPPDRGSVAAERHRHVSSVAAR